MRAGRDGPHLAHVLGETMGAFRSALVAEGGGSARLRTSHQRTLDAIPAEGIRPSALAERLRITRQGTGQLVDHLERIGYVATVPDPSDGRAKLVTCTPRGRRSQQATREAIDRVDARWRAQLGAQRYDDLIRALSEIALHEFERPEHDADDH